MLTEITEITKKEIDKLVFQFHICPLCYKKGSIVKLKPNGHNCYICPVCNEMFGICND